MAATFNPQAAADQARNAFTVIVPRCDLRPSDGARGCQRSRPSLQLRRSRRELLYRSYSYPCATESGPIGLAANALIKADCSFNWRDQDGGLRLAL